MSIVALAAAGIASIAGMAAADAILQGKRRVVANLTPAERRAALEYLASIADVNPSSCVVEVGRTTGRSLDQNRVTGTGEVTPHNGLDIPGPLGTEVYAAMPAICVFSGRISGYGEVVQLSHLSEDRTSTAYCHLMDRLRIRAGEDGVPNIPPEDLELLHLDQILARGGPRPHEVREGDILPGGAIIGHLGNSTYGPNGPPRDWAPGRAAGMSPHLHFEVHPTTNPVMGDTNRRLEPRAWLREHGIAIVCGSW